MRLVKVSKVLITDGYNMNVLRRALSSESNHFRINNTKHPLIIKKTYTDSDYGDHTGRLQNHIWSKDEIKLKAETLYRHVPKTISDKIMNKLMYGLYHTFNAITGYQEKNPSVKAIEWRLIVLESVAGIYKSLIVVVILILINNHRSSRYVSRNGETFSKSKTS